MMYISFVLSIIVGLITIKVITAWFRVTWTERPWLKYAPEWLPFIGHVLFIQDRKRMSTLREEWYKRFNNVFCLRIFFQRVVLTRDVRVWEDLLSSQKYIEKASGYWVLQKFLGEGLLTGAGDLWKKRRRIITPAFHFEILNDFLSVMENRTIELIQMLERSYSDHAFNAFEITKPFSLSIICETSMGITLSIEETSSGRFKQIYEELVKILFKRQLNPFARYDWIYSLTRNGKVYYKTYAELKSFVQDVIEKRLETRKNGSSSDLNKSKRKIFIDSLLDAYEKGDIDVKGIFDEVNTFVNAGYETTSTALAWALYCLARNTEAQEKLYKEISGFKRTSGSSLQMVDFKKMPYLDLVIKESLRLHPPAPRFGRHVKDGTVLGGREFPECSLIVDVISMNRNPQFWKDPLSFIPERFDETAASMMQENLTNKPNDEDESCNEEKIGGEKDTAAAHQQKRNPFLYIPFSAGPRNCIGQRFALSELKAALFHLVRHFEWSSSQREDELEEVFDLVHSCANGLMLNIRTRR